MSYFLSVDIFFSAVEMLTGFTFNADYNIELNGHNRTSSCN